MKENERNKNVEANSPTSDQTAFHKIILEPFFATYERKDLLHFSFSCWCVTDQFLDQLWIILAEIVCHQVSFTCIIPDPQLF